MLSGCLCETVHFFHCCRLPVCHMISREKTRDMQRNFPAGKRPDRCNPFSLLLHFWYPIIFTRHNQRGKLHMACRTSLCGRAGNLLHTGSRNITEPSFHGPAAGRAPLLFLPEGLLHPPVCISDLQMLCRTGLPSVPVAPETAKNPPMHLFRAIYGNSRNTVSGAGTLKRLSPVSGCRWCAQPPGRRLSFSGFFLLAPANLRYDNRRVGYHKCCCNCHITLLLS